MEDSWWSKILWSIWSKAVAKSNRKILELSNLLRIWWMNLNNACVVDDFFSEPYCHLTILSIMDFIRQSAINRSQILVKVDRINIIQSLYFFESQ